MSDAEKKEEEAPINDPLEASEKPEEENKEVSAETVKEPSPEPESPSEPVDERRFLRQSFGFMCGDEGAKKFMQGTFFITPNNMIDSAGSWGNVKYESLTELNDKPEWPSDKTQELIERLNNIHRR